jgi:hypothetical protein
MFKVFLKYILICFITTFDKSGIDLLDVKLNSTKVDEVLKRYDDYKDETMSGKTYKVITSQRVLTINGVELKNQYVDTTFSNHVWLEYDKNNTIKTYQLVYFTEKEKPRVVYNLLKEKMGTPDFCHFSSTHDRGKDNFDAVIWEDKDSKTFYKLEYSMWWDENIREVRLVAIMNTKANLESLEFSPYTYECWKDYIKERNQKGDEIYTYQDFKKRWWKCDQLSK